MPTFSTKWKNAFYSVNKFFSLQSNKNWLDRDFEIPLNTEFNESRKQKKNFETCSVKTKKRRCEELRVSLSNEEIEYAFFEMLRASGKKNAIPTIKKLISFETESNVNDAPIRLTDDEALALLIDADLTKAQYELIREKAKERNADIFPLYANVTKAKKECYPLLSSIKITDTCASTEFQDILNHTATRLMKVQNVVIPQSVKDCLEKIVLVTKLGADGTSGFNEYKQKWQNNENSDKYLFLVSMVPLCLKVILKDLTEIVIWNNPRPSSTNYCRPVKLEFAQETKEKVVKEFAEIDEKLRNLTCTKVKVNEETYLVFHETHCTMIDGKICQYITFTSSASVCSFCGATPKQMNDINAIKTRDVNVAAYRYCLPILHSWIRGMECMLHISYRLGFQKWTVKDKEDKELLETTKKRIQFELKKELGLIVDVPKQGSGTSNDGNTARTLEITR